MLLLVKRLRTLRESQKLSQEEFAHLAGISYKKYQPLESGNRKTVSLPQVEKLAAIYGLELWELIGPKEPRARCDVREAVLWRTE